MQRAHERRHRGERQQQPPDLPARGHGARRAEGAEQHLVLLLQELRGAGAVAVGPAAPTTRSVTPLAARSRRSGGRRLQVGPGVDHNVHVQVAEVRVGSCSGAGSAAFRLT